VNVPGDCASKVGTLLARPLAARTHTANRPIAANEDDDLEVPFDVCFISSPLPSLSGQFEG
jgi:hypothetical protein